MMPSKDEIIKLFESHWNCRQGIRWSREDVLEIFVEGIKAGLRIAQAVTQSPVTTEEKPKKKSKVFPRE